MISISEQHASIGQTEERADLGYLDKTLKISNLKRIYLKLG